MSTASTPPTSRSTTPPVSSSEDEDLDLPSTHTSPPSSSASSAASSPRARSPIKSSLLAPPQSAWRTISRSPSPLGLIPIHRQFSSLIHKHEVPRKLLHVSIGFLALHLYRTGYTPSSLLAPLTTALVPIATADVLRLRSPSFNAFYIRCLGALMRESEVRGWNGVVWYLVGTITVLYLFPKDIATLSILLLSWCDTAASTAGRAWGRYTPRIRRGKSLAGSLAAALVGAVTAGLFLGLSVQDGDGMWQGRLAWGDAMVTGGWAVTIMSCVTGVIASVSELSNVGGLDDNVVIPVLSAVGVWGFMKVFG